MKRDIRLKLDFVVQIDDDGVALPHVSDPGDVIDAVAKLIAPEGVVQKGGKLSVGFTRVSSAEIRRLDKQKPGAA